MTMEDILSTENIKFLLYSLGSVIAIFSTGLAIQWRFFRQNTENLQKLHKAELENLKAAHNKECTELHQKSFEESRKLRTTLENEFKKKESGLDDSLNIPLAQEMKMVYVKYLHIRRESEKPVYQKHISRLDENIDVHSEYHYYRFNKYNTKNNSITLTDRSTGIVDQNILYPWKKLAFTDIPTQKMKGIISQNVESSDCYFSATTYYNGFKENNEDIGMKMEMDTLEARMVADFSSIVGLDKLFVKEPDAYKMELDGRKTKLLGLEKISAGVYHIVTEKLKKGEALLLDFHVNWDYLNAD